MQMQRITQRVLRSLVMLTNWANQLVCVMDRMWNGSLCPPLLIKHFSSLVCVPLSTRTAFAAVVTGTSAAHPGRRTTDPTHRIDSH